MSEAISNIKLYVYIYGALTRVIYSTDQFEVTGSTVISLTCTGSGACTTNSTDLDVKYTALDPVQDPTRRVKYWVS